MKVVYVYLLVSIKASIISCKLNGEGHICGRPSGTNAIEEKIVAGFDVGYYKYPWYAALISDNIVACGGTLVGSKTIVSAAHCFKEYITGHHPNKTKLEDVYTVTLGIYNRCVKEKSQKKFTVHKVHVHEKYKDNVPYYDISLLILKESTTSYQPICLPKTVTKHRPREGTVPGLGTLRYHGATPCTLHEARLLIYSDVECRKMLNRTGNEPNKLFKAFCAGYLQGGIDTCQGDSGGPFQVTDEYGNVILLGLVSFGFHCANPNLLGVYTDVSQYIPWIEQKAGFNASIEAENNSTQSIIGNDNETTTAVSKPTKKPPKTPHGAHHEEIPHHGSMRPINIIIFRNKNRKKKITHQTNQKRKSKSKPWKKKKENKREKYT